MDNLLEEILSEIFSYLNFRDLCQLTLTCKSFNEVISNNSTLLDKFRLIYSRCHEVNVRMRKNYRNIEMYNASKIDLCRLNIQKLVKFLEIYGNNICDIRIIDYEIEMQELIRIFTLCPNVKRLHIEIKKVTNLNNDLNMPVVKLTLDSLLILNCDGKIFKILKISSKSIRMKSFPNSIINNKDAVVNLLRNQKHLKTLEIDSNFFNLFDDDSLANVEFQLETLIIGSRIYSSSNFENFKKFLNNQKSLRRIIGSESYYEINDCKYVSVLRDFKNIKELNVSGPYKFPQSMPHIENFTIYTPGYGEIPQNLHKSLPNLKNLNINERNFRPYLRLKIKFVKNYSEPVSNDYIEIKVPENVKTLTIENNTTVNDCLFDDDVEIKIEHLKIRHSKNINWLINCFKNDRMKLKSLTIERTMMKKSQREYLESLTRGENKKIEKLKIHMRMKFVENHGYICDYEMEKEFNVFKRIKLGKNF